MTKVKLTLAQLMAQKAEQMTVKKLEETKSESDIELKNEGPLDIDLKEDTVESIIEEKEDITQSKDQTQVKKEKIIIETNIDAEKVDLPKKKIKYEKKKKGLKDGDISKMFTNLNIELKIETLPEFDKYLDDMEFKNRTYQIPEEVVNKIKRIKLINEDNRSINNFISILLVYGMEKLYTDFKTTESYKNFRVD
jgi:hypothetical protein